MPTQDPDASLIAIFKHTARRNEAKSLEAGRPIFEDIEVCEIHRPGSRDFGVYPATSVTMWRDDPLSGESVPVTYAERFAHQYQQFKSQATQTKIGTPLSEVAFLTEGRRAELRAQNVYTVEALAGVDGQELKNLGPGGRELKNRAQEYINEGMRSAPNMQLQAELEAERTRNALLEEDVARLRKLAPSGEFDAMSDAELRAFITSTSGEAPHGSLPRKTLTRLAINARNAMSETEA